MPFKAAAKPAAKLFAVAGIDALNAASGLEASPVPDWKLNHPHWAWFSHVHLAHRTASFEDLDFGVLVRMCIYMMVLTLAGANKPVSTRQ